MSTIEMKKKVVAIAPRDWKGNPFVRLFATAIESQNYKVENFSWKPTKIIFNDIAILHWPNEFFTQKNGTQTIEVLFKILIMIISRKFFSVKFFWVAHNTTPHEMKKSSHLVRRAFISNIDGIIYLSNASKSLVEACYPECTAKRSLVTKHGHYRDVALTPPSLPHLNANRPVEIAYVGLLRQYKGVELLAAAAADPFVNSKIRLKLTGRIVEHALLNVLHTAAAHATNIALDIRENLLTDEEIELAVDESDAIILPYTKIVNSGVALYALSRNRPILAPRMGSLEELQNDVGTRWVHLFEGEISAHSLENFISELKAAPPSKEPPLSIYAWSKIAREISIFIDSF